MPPGFARMLGVSCLVLAAAQAGGSEPPRTAAHTDRYSDPLPFAALARLGTHRLRHGFGAFSVAFSPDGKTVASGGNGHVCLWDVATGKELFRFETDGRVRSIDFTPDGRTLVAARHTPPAVFLFDVTSGKATRAFGDFQDTLTGSFAPLDARNEVRSLAISPDGKVLVTGRDRIQFWEVATGKLLAKFPDKPESLRFTFVLLTPDGKSVISSAIDDRAILWWDRATGKVARRFAGHTEQPLCAALSADGKLLVSGGEDGLVRLWDVPGGKEIRQLRGHRYEVRAVALLPGGKAVVSASGDRICLWDTRTGLEVRRFAGYGGRVRAIALSADGKLLAAVTREGILHLWEAATGKELHAFEGHPGGISSIAFAPDGRALASAGSDALIIWGVPGGRIVRRYKGKTQGICRLAYAPDGKTLASGHWYAPPRLWDTSTGELRYRFDGQKDSAAGVSFSPDGRLLASGSREDGRHYLWETSTGKLRRRFGESPGEGASDRLTFDLMTPDGQAVVVGQVHQPLRLYSVRGEVPPREWPGGWSFSAAFSPGGEILALGDYDIALREMRTGKELRRWREHKGGTHCLAFSRDGKTLVSASGKNILCLWEVATGQERRQLAGHREEIWSVAISPDGKTLASAGGDTTILLWDLTAPRYSVPTPAGVLRPSELLARWADLGSSDASRAYDALSLLAHAPAAAVSFLRKHLSPVPSASPDRLARLLAELDGDDFAVRENASKELERLEEVALPALKRASDRPPSLEARKRIDRLLERLNQPTPSGARLRALRSVEVLEHIGTAGARRLLDELGKGAPQARLTQEAKESLKRLKRRSGPGRRESTGSTQRPWRGGD